MLTLRGDGHGTEPEFAFFCRRPEYLADRRRRFTLSPEDIALINPNTRTCPIFRTGHDAELTKAIYRRVPVLIDESRGEAGNPWGISFLRMFDMANDSGLFRTYAQLREAGGELTGTVWTFPNEERWLPLYEAKMIHHFDHRWASYGEDGREAGDLSEAEKADPSFRALPRYWVEAREVYLRIADLPKGLLAALRDRNTELIVLGLAHLLFGPWPRQVAGDTVAGAMRNLLPAWRSFVAHHSFAHDIAPTQLGLCGNSPPYMMPDGPEYLPAEPLHAIEDSGRTKTAWYAANEQ